MPPTLLAITNHGSPPYIQQLRAVTIVFSDAEGETEGSEHDLELSRAGGHYTASECRVGKEDEKSVGEEQRGK